MIWHPKTAHLLTVEHAEADLFSEGVVRVAPGFAVPNDENWSDFSAVVDIVNPHGKRLRKRAHFGKWHPLYGGHVTDAVNKRSFWIMRVTIHGVDKNDIPVGTIVLADDSVVARVARRTASR